jgi:hypothetical protein
MVSGDWGRRGTDRWRGVRLVCGCGLGAGAAGGWVLRGSRRAGVWFPRWARCSGGDRSWLGRRWRLKMAVCGERNKLSRFPGTCRHVHVTYKQWLTKRSPDMAVTLTFPVHVVNHDLDVNQHQSPNLSLLRFWPGCLPGQYRHESCPSAGPLCVRRPANRRLAGGENCATPDGLMRLAWLAPASPIRHRTISGQREWGEDCWRRRVETPMAEKRLRTQPSPILLPTSLHSTPARHFPPFSVRTFEIRELNLPQNACLVLIAAR